MGVTTQNSVQIDNERHENRASDLGGMLKIARFVHDQDGAGDAGSSVAIAKLPAGRVQVFLPLSQAYVNWTTGSALVDFGWDAYVGLDGVEVVADTDGLANDIDVESAGYFNFGAFGTQPSAMKALGGVKEFTSKSGVTLRMTSPTAIVSGDDAVGYVVYTQG